MDAEQLEAAILARLQSPDYRPEKPKVIAAALDLNDDDRALLRKTIKRLVKRGTLAWGPRHLVELPGGSTSAKSASPSERTKGKKHPAGEIVGTFRQTEQGYGFVRPLDTDPALGREHDIYIPAEDTLDAASGDTVRLRLGKRGGPQGKLRGRIVEVVERQTRQFVGVYFESAGQAYVEVDGAVFAQPIAVGDPGAKNAQRDDKVVFEMVRFPSQSRGGEGVVTEVLGPRGTPGVDTLSIIREYGLPETFPEDVLDDARQQAERFDEALADRLDLTADVIVTIDPVDARDFDDAISLTRIDNDHWRLGVHIADVAHFVPTGSPLDREAMNRGTSVYLPDRVLPMLPEVISNSLASLQPDRVRYTKSVFIEFTPEGQKIASDAHRAAIRSCRRFTYEEIDDYLAHRERWRAKLRPEVWSLVSRMHELAMILRERRLRGGALELTLGETKVDLDTNGRVVGAHLVENTVSHQIIEEFMLAANEAVAEMLAEAKIPFLRRVHDPPDPRKLEQLTLFVNELGFSRRSLESRFELQSLLNLVADRPERHAVNYAVLRSLQRAVYSPREEGHYALASDCYCHFTSPIRRYPDLTVHRLLDGLLRGKKAPSDLAHLTRLGIQCSDRERRAEEAERELTKLKILNFLAERVGQEMDAVITGVEPFGLFAEGIELPAEGLVHVSSLADDRYRFDRTTHSLIGFRAGNSFRLGDTVRVVVAHVDPEQRKLEFRLVDHRARSEPATKNVGSGGPPGRAGANEPSRRQRRAAKSGSKGRPPRAGARGRRKRKR